MGTKRGVGSVFSWKGTCWGIGGEGGWCLLGLRGGIACGTVGRKTGLGGGGGGPDRKFLIGRTEGKEFWVKENKDKGGKKNRQKRWERGRVSPVFGRMAGIWVLKVPWL